MANKNSTIIGLDIGERRIGVAMTSLVARLPAPHGVISNDSNAVESICKLTVDEQAKALVIGLPRGLQSQETAQTQTVRNFAGQLEKDCQLPIYFQDEALTSKQAEEELRQRRVSYTKEAVDALAATYILNDFLQEHPEFKE